MAKDEWYKQLFERLGNSKSRSSFHLKQKDIDYINDKGLDNIRQHARDSIAKRAVPGVIPNDGKRTSAKGHPVLPCYFSFRIDFLIILGYNIPNIIRNWRELCQGKDLPGRPLYKRQHFW